MAPKPVIAIVGATATGKTDAAEAVAMRIGGEVVCADSRQVFRELEIGTGKPTPTERASRPHHLFGSLALGDPASAGWYATAARAACAGIHSRGAIPVLVGGSGFYLQAARLGIAPTPPVDAVVRARVRGAMEAEGPAALHTRLAQLDPDSAARLAPNDRQRIARALEVLESSGHPMSWWHARPRAPGVRGVWWVLELTASSGHARTRIDARTRWMFGSGLIEETRVLLAGPSAHALRELNAIGYDEAIDLIEGRGDLAAAEARTSLRTLQLAKRQRTWFRAQPADLRLPCDTARADIADHVASVVAAL